MTPFKILVGLIYLVSLILPCHSTYIGRLYIPSLRIAEPRFRQQSNSIKFVFSDPNTPENPATCSLAWPSSPGNPVQPPSTTTPCSNSTYRFSFPADTYKSISEFQLQLSHTIIDNDIGPAPYNRLTMFAWLDVVPSENFTCKSNGKVCGIPEGKGPLVAVVTALTAK